MSQSSTAYARPFVFGPFLDLRDLVDEEDALALSLGSRLHDPCAVRILLEVFGEHIVVGRHHIRHTFRSFHILVNCR